MHPDMAEFISQKCQTFREEMLHLKGVLNCTVEVSFLDEHSNEKFYSCGGTDHALVNNTLQNKKG